MSSAGFYRSNSSPNLTDNNRKWRKHNHRNYYEIEFENDDEFFVVGDRVYVDKYRPGSVAYFGEVDYATGDWVGVVLDDPTGNHNGKVHGYEYFQCAPFQGIFVRPHRVTRMMDSALGSTSREPTPLPTFQHSLLAAASSPGQRSKSPGSSTLGSYYYDDDYRQTRAPSVASLARKLRSLDGNKQSNSYYDASPSAHESATHGRPQQATGSILKTTKSNGGNPSPILDEFPPRSSIGSRAEELSRRIDRASSSNDRGTVFNFRPKREQLVGGDGSYSASPLSSNGRRSVNLATEPPKKGDRVLVQTERGQLVGILRFMGQTNFALGEWAGIELDNCEGKNDGSVLGHRYFYCPKNYGLFVPANRVSKYESSSMEFERMRSTVLSPPPRMSSYDTCASHSRSTTPGQMSSSSSLLNDYPSYNRRSHDTPSSTYSTGYSSGGGQYDNFNGVPSHDNDGDKFTKPLSNNTHLLNSKYWSQDDSSRRLKFDERDLDAKLKQSLMRSKSSGKISGAKMEPARPKAVEYTFTSSKYDGNPIARRTLVYE